MQGEETIIAIGGLEISEATATLETTEKIYWLNIEQQTWPEFTSMPDRRRCHSVCILNNKLYVVGGFDVDDQLLDSGYRYDLQKNDWMILVQFSKKRTHLSP